MATYVRSTKTCGRCSSTAGDTAGGAQRPHVGSAARRTRRVGRSPLRSAGVHRARGARRHLRRRTLSARGRRDRATCVPTDEPADVAVDVDVLGAAYLGGAPLRPYVIAGRIQELTRAQSPRSTAACAPPKPPGPPPASDARVARHHNTTARHPAVPRYRIARAISSRFGNPSHVRRADHFLSPNDMRAASRVRCAGGRPRPGRGLGGRGVAARASQSVR